MTWPCLMFLAGAPSIRQNLDPAAGSFAAYLSLLVETHLLTAADASRADHVAPEGDEERERWLAEARRTTTVLHDVMSALATGDELSATQLDELNRLVRRAMPHLCLTNSVGGVAWSGGDDDAVAAALANLVWNAVELISTPRFVRRLRVCADPRCRRLFVDTTKNASRRWCDARACGNRAKARRHYDRVRGERARARHDASQADGVR